MMLKNRLRELSKIFGLLGIFVFTVLYLPLFPFQPLKYSFSEGGVFDFCCDFLPAASAGY